MYSSLKRMFIAWCLGQRATHSLAAVADNEFNQRKGLKLKSLDLASPDKVDGPQSYPIKVWVSEKCSKKYSKKHSKKVYLLKKGLKKVNALF